VRTAAFGWVELLSRKAYSTLATRAGAGWTYETLWKAMAPYWADHESLGIDGDARSAERFEIIEEPGQWVIVQHLVDPAGDMDWRFTATVDLAAAEDAGVPTLVLRSLGRFGEELTHEVGS
jgi:hypothetical protein